VLLAYGGAGPVHAAQVAAALGIRQVMYPLRAGVMSALGFLAAPVAFERMRADVGLLDALDPGRANGIVGELAAEARELVRAAGVPAAACVVKREVALRFAGQSYALLVPLPSGRLTRASLKELRAQFIALYRKRYYRLNPDVPVEVVNWRVTVTGPKPDLSIAPLETAGRSTRKGRRPVYFAEADRYVDCAVYDRAALAPGRRLRGPAVIEEPESTVVMGPGSSAVIDRDGNLMATLAVQRAGRSVREAA
jgi:N-methylhydantoinase A